MKGGYNSIMADIEIGAASIDEYEQIWSSDDLLKLIKSRQYDKQNPESQVEHIDGCDFLNLLG